MRGRRLVVVFIKYKERSKPFNRMRTLNKSDGELKDSLENVELHIAKATEKKQG